MAAKEQPTGNIPNEMYRKQTSFRRDMLWIIMKLEDEMDEGPHGLAIKDEIEQYYGSEVNHGRLYPNLDALARDGLIDKGTIDDRTNSYQLTEDGREALQERKLMVSSAVVSHSER